MPAYKDKVLAYITHGNRLLVFRHPHAPEAGIQVPAGTVEEGEDPGTAVLREAAEETGLDAGADRRSGDDAAGAAGGARFSGDVGMDRGLDGRDVRVTAPPAEPLCSPMRVVGPPLPAPPVLLLRVDRC